MSAHIFLASASTASSKEFTLVTKLSEFITFHGFFLLNATMVELEPGLLVLFQPSKQYAEKIIVELIRSFLENHSRTKDETMETFTGFDKLVLIAILTGDMRSFCLGAMYLFRLSAFRNSKMFKTETFCEQNIGQASPFSAICFNNLNLYYEKCIMESFTTCVGWTSTIHCSLKQKSFM